MTKGREIEQAVVNDYKMGMTKTQITTKHGISHTWLYKLLKKYHIPLQKPAGQAIEAFCDVCGQALAPPQKNNYQGAWRYVYTCKDWQCRSILGLRPELRDAKKLSHQGKPKQGRKAFFPKTASYEQNRNIIISRWTKCELSPSLLKKLHAHTPTNERWWMAGEKDERGVEANQAAQDAFWGAFSRQHVAIRLIDNQGANVALLIQRRRDESTVDAFVRLFFGGDTAYANGFDAILAWRCSCGLKTQIVYTTLNDLPQTKGYHVACSCCGAVCLEIS